MRTVIYALIIWLIGTIQPVLSHTSQGHLIITQRALNQLSKPEVDYFDGIAKQLLVQLKPEYQKPKETKYKQASAAALISQFPDDFKNYKVRDLYKEFGVQIPSIMKPFLNQYTSKWHYMNKPLVGSCKYSSNNIQKYLPLVIKAFKESVALKDKAIMLSYIEHLVADIHQPLHTYNQFDNRCKHDAGGNNYCIKSAKLSSAKCRLTLHSLWDDSVGWLSNSKNVRQHISQLNQINSNNKPSVPISSWIKENKQAARYAYSTNQYSSPKKQYYVTGQLIMKKRFVDASDRLALILKALYRAR